MVSLDCFFFFGHKCPKNTTQDPMQTFQQLLVGLGNSFSLNWSSNGTHTWAESNNPSSNFTKKHNLNSKNLNSKYQNSKIKTRIPKSNIPRIQIQNSKPRIQIPNPQSLESRFQNQKSKFKTRDHPQISFSSTRLSTRQF